MISLIKRRNLNLSKELLRHCCRMKGLQKRKHKIKLIGKIQKILTRKGVSNKSREVFKRSFHKLKKLIIQTF